jgi:hypothetical protein
VLTLQKCRSVLGTDCKLTDSELEQLRQELYAYADIALESFRASKTPQIGPIVESCLDAIPDHERETVAERAAILEYEGHLQKPEAERQAFGEWVQSKKLPGEPRRNARKKKPRKSKPI